MTEYLVNNESPLNLMEGSSYALRNFRLPRGANEIFLFPGQAAQGELDCLAFEDGTDILSRNVSNYQSTLRNIPEERRFFFSVLFNDAPNCSDYTVSVMNE
jgi:hypothetical protein